MKILWRVRVIERDAGGGYLMLEEVQRALVIHGQFGTSVAENGVKVKWEFRTLDDEPVTIVPEGIRIEGLYRPCATSNRDEERAVELELLPVELVRSACPDCAASGEVPDDSAVVDENTSELRALATAPRRIDDQHT